MASRPEGRVTDGEARVPRRPAAPAWLGARLRAAAVPVDAALAWRAWQVAVVVAVVGGATTGGAGLALVAGAVAALAPVAVLWAGRGRADVRYQAALPQALEAVARALRTGASPTAALGEAATTAPTPLAGDLARVAHAARHGRPLVDALDDWARARPLPPVRLAVAALGLGIETGGAQARAVDGVAATIRDRLAVAGEVRALSSQTRASALLISVAPLAFGVLAAAADPRTSTFLLRTPLGLAFLVAGLTLDGLAALWMAHLTRSRL